MCGKLESTVLYNRPVVQRRVTRAVAAEYEYNTSERCSEGVMFREVILFLQ